MNSKPQKARPPAESGPHGGRGRGGDNGSAPRIAESATSQGRGLSRERAASGREGDAAVNGRSKPFIGWGFHVPRRTLCPRSDRAVALLALRRAPRALLALSPGLIARDMARTLRVDYRIAYRAARDVRHLTSPRAAW